ncbi:MAG: hypothetical protein JNL38_18890 [Myxococcales bacterium]|jgi:hypothetical protein|nr:hypothetical protein [Myxococcales bacterium]
MSTRGLLLIVVSSLGLVAGCAEGGAAGEGGTATSAEIESASVLPVEKSILSACAGAIDGRHHEIAKSPIARMGVDLPSQHADREAQERVDGTASHRVVHPSPVGEGIEQTGKLAAPRPEVRGDAHHDLARSPKESIGAEKVADLARSPKASVPPVMGKDALLPTSDAVAITAEDGGFSFHADGQKLGCDGGRLEAKLVSPSVVAVELHKSEGDACTCGVGVRGTIRGLQPGKSYIVTVSRDRSIGEGKDLLAIQSIVAR